MKTVKKAIAKQQLTFRLKRLIKDLLIIDKFPTYKPFGNYSESRVRG